MAKKRTRRVKRSTRKRSAARKKTSRRKKSSTMKFEVKQSVLREIWAVVYFGLAAVTFLSIRGAFGIIGDLLMDVLNPMLGWGIFILPPTFLLVSFMLFFARKINFGLAKIVGITLMITSVLSIIHLAVPLEQLHEVARQGEYGGYVGFVTNFFMRTWLNIGNVGASVVFITMGIVSILLTFEVSLAEIARFFKPELKKVSSSSSRKRKKEKEDDTEDEISAENMEVASDDVLKAIYGTKDTNIRIKRARPLNEKASQTDDADQSSQAEKDTDNQTTQKSTNNKAIEDEMSENAKEKKQDDDPDYADWEFPSLDLLDGDISEIESDDDILKENAEKIRSKLEQFGINVTMHDIHVGPTVIQYTLKPDEGVKLSKITSLKNDLALALAAPGVRIEAPIPGKSLVGIEVPNQHRAIVHLREILESGEFKKGDSQLKFPLGRDVSGRPIIADLKNMPHLLIAGATGSGKSVGMNTFLISLLYQNSPLDLKLILVDPKKVELRDYNSIPHLLTPVINDPEKASIALRWCVAEMNRRYQTCADKGKRNITDYNADTSIEEKMSTIVVVIDELSDLMMSAGKEVEASICRIAQMARAVGMHLVIATQRPSVDVITGLIKANIPSRIAFAVSSSIDSRTVLDATGAEDLLGKGDMLYLPSGKTKPIRVQGIYTSSKEIENVTNRVKLTAAPDFNDEVVSTRVAGKQLNGIPASSADSAVDSLYEDALKVIKDNRKASASLLQRRLKVGYARAARILDSLEEHGVVGPSNGSKPRKILID
ncbi:cell division protein FtsK [Candidatus Peregrinibacteria bacterium]|nr:cell division protein FtsK [Candidatus Peregrinibacteria bacterium]